MRKNRAILAASCLFAQAALGQVADCDIQVINLGFEDPVLTDNTYSYFIPGWVVVGDAGAFNPGPVSYPDGLVVQGRNCGYVSCCTGGRVKGIMSQTLPAVLTPSTTYDLSMWIGQRLETPWANFRLELLAGKVVLIDELIDTPPEPGKFKEIRFHYVSGPAESAAGLRLQIRMSHEGEIEHQADYDTVSLVARSIPVTICTQPVPVQTCHGVTAEFNVSHGGVDPFSYQWYKDNVALHDGDTAWGSTISGTESYHLTINNVHTPDDGNYSVAITNDSGTVKSQDAALLVCLADFNCDGMVDFFDYLDFVDAFTGNVVSADWNEDGSIDFFDYLDFVNQYATGC